MKQKREVAIINFNTPELVEAAILSLRKHGGKDYHVTVFDNSRAISYKQGQGLPERTFEARPFKKRMRGLKYIDNTNGKVIDFDKELAKYQDRCPIHAECNDWGSTKHIMTVQKLWELLPDGFLLMESDVLLKDSVEHMFMDDQVAVGHVQCPQPGNLFGLGRLVPMLCYFNVPLCRKYGLTYFDPERSWMLWPDERDKRNWYDTGAAFYEDIHNHKNGCRGRRIDIRPLIVHKQSGSWNKHNMSDEEWLEIHKELWKREKLP